VDSSPHNCVLPARSQTCAHQESEFTLEGQNQESQALYALRVAGQESSSTCARVPCAVRERAVREPVLNHDHEGTALLRETRKRHSEVLSPRHGSWGHSACPDSVTRLADHALIEASRLTSRVVVRLEALRVEKVRLTRAPAHDHDTERTSLSLSQLSTVEASSD